MSDPGPATAQDPAPAHLTTRELAQLLRLSERKIYDLAAQGQVPCLRVVGKLLFPRAEIEAWLAAAREGPGGARPAPPPVIAGSHDPLLDWALRESGSGLSAWLDGSRDGLDRLANGQAMAAGIHLPGPEGNLTAAKALSHLPLVLIRMATRQRGLIVAPGNPASIGGIADLPGRRVARRQAGAAAEEWLAALCRQEGIDAATLPGPDAPARSEQDVALMVQEGAAEAGLGLESLARQFGLGFVPLLEERFDLLAWRWALFEPPLARLRGFMAGPTFAARAEALAGVSAPDAGAVLWNSPAV